MSCTNRMFHILGEVEKCNHLRLIYLRKAHFQWVHNQQNAMTNHEFEITFDEGVTNSALFLF